MILVQKLVRCLVTRGGGASLNDALYGVSVGSRVLLLLPSSQALEAVGMAGCADEGVWCVTGHLPRCFSKSGIEFGGLHDYLLKSSVYRSLLKIGAFISPSLAALQACM